LKMKVCELRDLIGATVITGETGLENDIQSGYCCDLLSWVMAHGSAGMAWVTVQTHMNVIAVATLHEMSCVVIPEGAQMDKEIADKAAEEGIAVLLSDKPAYEICGRLAAQGIPARG